MADAASIVSELLHENRKCIYCFGAGHVFNVFIHKFAAYNPENKIKAIVDNSLAVIRKKVKVVNNVSVPIISFEDLLRNIENGDKIFITTAAYEEIIEQLKKAEIIHTIRYYIYPVLEIEQEDYDRLNIAIPSELSLYKSIQIPRTIHYCWFGKKEIPDQYRKWMESWKKYCPDYEIIQWNEENYDVHKNRYVSQAYEAGQWAFVSDYARIDIIRAYGGVYLDVDVELLKNIDVMLMNDAFCGFESKGFVNYGLGFGAKKDNFILGEIKEYYDHKDFLCDDGTLNRINCPVIQTEIMKRHGLTCNGEFQIADGMVVYPSRVLCGMSPHSYRIERNPVHTYAVHHFAGSWLESKREKNKLISAMKKWSKNDHYIYPDL